MRNGKRISGLEEWVSNLGIEYFLLKEQVEQLETKHDEDYVVLVELFIALAGMVKDAQACLCGREPKQPKRGV